MASVKKAARKPKPATNGLGSDEVDGLQRWGKTVCLVSLFKKAPPQTL